MKYRFLLALTFLLATSNAHSQIALDQSFGTGGVSLISNPSTGFYEKGMTLQPDGKLIVSNGAGTVSFGRLKSNGGVDAGFASGGWVNLGNYAVGDIEVQNDGKILVTARPSIISNQDLYMWRYDSTGTLDMSFGSGGRVNDTSMAGAMERVAMGGNGKIIWTGSGGMRRLNSNGSTDNTFGNLGHVVSTQLPIYISDITTDTTTGDIYAVGITKGTGVTAIIKITSAGVLDHSFAYSGIDSTNYAPSAFGYVQFIHRTTSGKIVVASDYENGGHTYTVVMQFDNNGMPDMNFGTNGVKINNWNTTYDVFLGGMDIQQDEKIIVTANAPDTTRSGSYYDIVTQRLNTDGTEDTQLGMARLDNAGANDLASEGLVQDDGKYVIIGKSGGEQIFARYYDLMVGIDEADNTFKNIFPNPASQSFSIFSENTNESLSLFDTTGRMVLAHSLIQGKNTIDVGSLSNGVYIVHLNNSSTRLIIAK